MPSMSEPRCDGCRFWVRIHEDMLHRVESSIFEVEDGKVPVGECHRFPPKLDGAAYEVLHQKRLSESGFPGFDQPIASAWQASKFPILDESDWCGEFEAASPG
jgi:hypothetical protein